MACVLLNYEYYYKKKKYVMKKKHLLNLFNSKPKKYRFYFKNRNFTQSNKTNSLSFYNSFIKNLNSSA